MMLMATMLKIQWIASVGSPIFAAFVPEKMDQG
jgi:hypothetical protein